MSNMNDLWFNLDLYQPYANRRDCGAEWATMMAERTQETCAVMGESDKPHWLAAWSAANTGELIGGPEDASQIDLAIEMVTTAISEEPPL